MTQGSEGGAAEVVGELYTPGEVGPFYDELALTYQQGFAKPPWREVSKCVDPGRFQRCVGGFSALAVGKMCNQCGHRTQELAYPRDKLVAEWECMAQTYPTAWYLERFANGGGTTLAALAWCATATEIGAERYGDVPAMDAWLPRVLGDDKVMWLDDVFANTQLHPTDNLHNFGAFVKGLAEKLDAQTVAYLTIVPAMLHVAERDFGTAATVYKREADVPDRRNFVRIKI